MSIRFGMSSQKTILKAVNLFIQSQISYKLNKVIINESSKFSALGRYAKDLSLASETELFTLFLDKSKSIENFEGTIFVPKPFLKIRNGWFYYHRFPNFSLRKIKCEINKEIHGDTIIHYASQGIPKLDLDNRYIYTIHDLFGLDEKYNADAKLRKLLRKNLEKVFLADKIVVVSNFVKSEIETFKISSEIVKIYPPVSSTFKPISNKSLLRKELNLPLEKKLILNVSSNDPRKNIPAILKTRKLLGNNYELVRVGRPLEEGYSFSNIDETTLNKIYNACDVLLFPSLDEGFGYPIVEAMTVGLPIVGSDIEVFKEIAKDEAILVKPTPENLSKAIVEIVSKPEDYTIKGLIRAKQFSFENFKLKINELYRHLGLGQI